MSLSLDELGAFVANLAADSESWQGLVAHDPDHRVYALLWDDENVNAWLICWAQDDDTGFHDHDASGAAITVIDGQVREDRLRLNGEPSTTFSGPGALITIPPNAIHRVLHAGEVPAVTIHAYSPPLIRTGAYAVSDDGELLREAQDGAEELRAELTLH
jgi:quercetin dioxygenase-like cupin family protein